MRLRSWQSDLPVKNADGQSTRDRGKQRGFVDEDPQDSQRGPAISPTIGSDRLNSSLILRIGRSTIKSRPACGSSPAMPTPKQPKTEASFRHHERSQQSHKSQVQNSRWFQDENRVRADGGKYDIHTSE